MRAILHHPDTAMLGAAAALLAIPTTYFFIELARMNRAH